MKTIKDIEEMKNHKTVMFHDAYNMLLMRLEDFYISKSNGIERIKSELEDWDAESKKMIVNDVIVKIAESGLKNFNDSELLKLIV